jgi:hypothetical protein
MVALAACVCVPLSATDGNHITNLAFVGYSDKGPLVLAVPNSSLAWRYRDFFLPERLDPQTVLISRSGTKLFGLRASQADPIVFDLTSHPVVHSQHHLPNVKFPLIRKDRIDIFDDREGHPEIQIPEVDALAAAVDLDGILLVATGTGALTYWPPPKYSQKTEVGVLPCKQVRLLGGARCRWIAICGTAGDNAMHSVYSINISLEQPISEPMQFRWSEALIAGNLLLSGNNEADLKSQSFKRTIQKLSRGLRVPIDRANCPPIPTPSIKLVHYHRCG